MNQKKYSISEVAELLEYEPHVLRYYENEFDIEVPRNKGKRREYTITEIESFQYIKELKEQGFNNSQIKQILKSPTIEDDGDNNESGIENSLHSNNGNEIAMTMDYINQIFATNFSQVNENILNLKSEIEELKLIQQNDEKDVLLAENAKLKMRLKEKTYELVDIKEKFTRLENKKFIFKKFFK